MSWYFRKNLYIKEVTKTLQTVGLWKPKTYWVSFPPVILSKDVIVIRRKQHDLSSHPRLIYERFTSLCICICTQIIIYDNSLMIIHLWLNMIYIYTIHSLKKTQCFTLRKENMQMHSSSRTIAELQKDKISKRYIA